MARVPPAPLGLFQDGIPSCIAPGLLPVRAVLAEPATLESAMNLLCRLGWHRPVVEVPASNRMARAICSRCGMFIMSATIVRAGGITNNVYIPPTWDVDCNPKLRRPWDYSDEETP